MIQRIQTIFLLLVVVCMGITIGSTLWIQTSPTATTWELSAFMLDQTSPSGDLEASTPKWYIGALAAFVGLMALISIFQYKNRARQMMLNMINSLLMVGLVVLVFLTTNGVNTQIQSSDSGTYQVGFWVILAAMVLNMLANRFIRKDEALVRSVDRIR